MPSSQIERKLAAIMSTDIAGYTALSAKDSTKASKLLKTQKDTLKPIVEKHGGSWVKEMADGLLFTFDSATSAVECSIAIQEATKDIEDLNLRIGIHEGEVIKQDGDVIGDDVNIAFRIEPFSAVGGVAITHKIEQAISSNKEFETKYIGKPKLKGVSQEIKVYCITSQGLLETDVLEVPVENVISKAPEKISPSTKNIILISTLLGIIFYTNILPLLQDLVNDDRSYKTAVLAPGQKLYVIYEHPSEVAENIRQIKNHLTQRDEENNLEAHTLADALIIGDSTQADYYAYRGWAYFQRYNLNKEKSVQILLESEKDFIKALNLSNITQDPAVISYYHLASIYMIRGNVDNAYAMIRKAMRVDNKYPDVKNRLKEINKRRIQALEKTS